MTWAPMWRHYRDILFICTRKCKGKIRINDYEVEKWRDEVCELARKFEFIGGNMYKYSVWTRREKYNDGRKELSRCRALNGLHSQFSRPWKS